MNPNLLCVTGRLDPHPSPLPARERGSELQRDHADPAGQPLRIALALLRSVLKEGKCGGHPHVPGRALRPCSPQHFAPRNHGRHVQSPARSTSYWAPYLLLVACWRGGVEVQAHV